MPVCGVVYVRSLSGSVAAWLIISAFCLRFIVWYLELSRYISPTSFTTILAIATALIVVVRISRTKRWQWTVTDTISTGVLIYCGFVAYLGYVEYGEYRDLDDVSLTAYNATIFFQSVLYYILGRFFLGDALSRQKMLLCGWGAMSLFIVANTKISPFGLDLDRMDDEVRGIYLSLADMYALLSLVVVALEVNSKNAMRLALVAASILFLLHSRGAFVVFLVASSFLMFSQMSAGLLIKYVTLAFLLLVPIAAVGWDYIASNERMIGILLDPLNDSSLQSRLLQLLGGIQDIVEHPLTGKYGGQVDMYGYKGWYIHSILSYWRQFGFFPFVSVLLLVFFIPLRTFGKTRGIPRKYRALLLVLLAYCSVQVVFVKAYEWYFLWMFVGYVGWLNRRMPL